MNCRHLRPSDYRSTPWKNGKGVTTELAISPRGATLADFDWRVSSAAINEPGEFSSFAGYSRELVVLEGEGLILATPSGERRLEPFHVFRFDGADPISCRLLRDPVRDFNLIFKKRAVDGEILILSGDLRREIGPGSYLYHCVSGSARVLAPKDMTLSAGDSAHIEIGDDEFMEFDLQARQATGLFVRIRRQK